MLTLQQAQKIAEDKLNAMNIDDLNRMIIYDNSTIEKQYAWIFFYNSKRYIETGNILYALGGNAPLFISKFNGQISTFRTGLSIEEMIIEYEEKQQIWKLNLTENIYSDTNKLLDLKQILNLSNIEMADFKSSNKITMLVGSETRLLNLQKALNSKNINTEILLQDFIFLPTDSLPQDTVVVNINKNKNAAS